MNPASITPASVASLPPNQKHFHGSLPRGLDLIPSSFSTAGRFGRLFRNIPVLDHRVENLAVLARTMVSPADPRDAAPVPTGAPLDERENPLIPAGYTYLGQFIDHDITFDPVSSLQRQNDPDALHNFRTPRFDLDSVYGRGPADQPYLYRNGPQDDPHPVLGFDRRAVFFLHGENRTDPNDPAQAPFSGPDLPRNSDGRALIGDPRNDENLIVSQLHMTFMRFHNRMVEFVFRSTGLTGDDLFQEAQRLVRWHYQWVVVHDYLPRIVDGETGEGKARGTGVVGDILKLGTYATSDGTGRVIQPKLHFFHWREQPFLPVEFSVAAYRFGHSMVRPSYFINDFVRQQTNDVRIALFSPSADPLANLTGLRPLPQGWGIQWKYFFPVEPGFEPQHSFKIDTHLAAPLGILPGRPDMPNLAQRNLIRGIRLGLPSGQTVARAMGIRPLSDSDLELSARGAPDFDGDAPLWFYVLREAEVLAGSQHLGPVGGRIVAEVLIGLLVGDPLSWLNVQPDWEPPLAESGKFGMAELIRFALGDQSGSAPTLPPTLTRWRSVFGSGDEPRPT